MPRVASRFGVNVAGALPFEESGAIRGFDGGFFIVLVVDLLLNKIVGFALLTRRRLQSTLARTGIR